MFTSTPRSKSNESHAADVLIPLIRTAATIGFAVAPCSLGFVIIAVSEQLIRCIMVGEDPVLLMSDLQQEFPRDALEVVDHDEEVVARIVDVIERAEGPEQLRAVLENVSADATLRLFPPTHLLCLSS